MKARTENTVVRWTDTDGTSRERSFERPREAHQLADVLKARGLRPVTQRKLVDVSE